MSSRNDYWAYFRPRSSDLSHYGVKGMKWGVRNDYVPTGEYRHINRPYVDQSRNTVGSGRSRTTGHVSPHSKKTTGKNIVSKWQGTFKAKSNSASNKKPVNKAKLVRNILLGAAAVSAATVVGLELYKYGKMSADTVLKKGTVAQSLAVAEKTDWSKSFYVATGQDDRRKLLKNFTGVLSKEAKEGGLSGEVYSNIFTNKNSVRIAGRKALRQSYKNVYGTTKGFGKYIDKFNTFDQAKRQPLMDDLARRGYGGFKDQAGMKKWWGGKTPIVLNGDRSGFELRNRAKVNQDVTKNIFVKDIGGRLRNVEEAGMKAAPAALAAGGGVQVGIMTRNAYVNQNRKRRT